MVHHSTSYYGLGKFLGLGAASGKPAHMYVHTTQTVHGIYTRPNYVHTYPNLVLEPVVSQLLLYLSEVGRD